MPEETSNITRDPTRSAPLDTRLYALFSAAIEDGLGIVKKMAEHAVYITSHWEWPKLTWRKNGLPSLSEQYDAPKDYGMALRSAGKSNNEVIRSPFAAGRAFQELLAYAQSHARINSHLSMRDSELVSNFLESLVGDVLDRYVHLHPGFTFQPDDLLPIYLPIEKHLLEENLDIALMVPILFLSFDDDKFELDDRTFITRMSDDVNLARAPQTRFSYGRNPIVEQSAAFALSLLGYSLPNASRVGNWRILGAAESYPTDTVDQFFACLRIVTGYASGYAQLLAVPLGWASDYNGVLLPLSDSNEPLAFHATASSQQNVPAKFADPFGGCRANS